MTEEVERPGVRLDKNAHPRVSLEKRSLARDPAAKSSDSVAPAAVAPPTRPPFPAPQRYRKRSLWLIGGALIAVLLVAGAVTGVVLSTGSDDSDRGGDAVSTKANADDPLEAEDDVVSQDDFSIDDEGDLDTSDDPEENDSQADPESEAEARLQLLLAEDTEDAAALEGGWAAQLSSSAADDAAVDVLAKYDELIARYPDTVLVWSGDWPGSFGPSSLASWVMLRGEVQDTTAPVLDWCRLEGLGDGDCWAKRLERSGDSPDLNTDRWPADDRNN